MKPDQIWLDLSTPELRVWMDAKLNLAHARGNSQHRVGFFREIPLFHLSPTSAVPLNWTSFSWKNAAGKFGLDEEFWASLEAARFTLFSQPTEHSNLVPPLALNFPLASDVIFYGGTFDPWHEGHQACLNLAPQDIPIIVCPDRNPEKVNRIGEGLPHYLKLAKLIATRATLSIYPGFLLQEEPNPTVKWILKVKRNRPDLRLHLLMGFDNLLSLKNWFQAEDLLKLLSGIYVVSRLEDDTQHASAVVWPKSINPRLGIHFLGHHPFEGFSSRTMR